MDLPIGRFSLIMRDMAGKIAELKFEAPLARFEEEDTASLKNMNLLTGALIYIY